MLVPIRLEDIDDARERRLGSSSPRVAAMMQPGIAKGRKLGKRPVSRQGTLNQQVIARSPGSRIPCIDFVKAVYSDRTGQEGMY
jgi:hypothetical protein